MNIPGNAVTSGWEAVHTLADLGKMFPNLPDFSWACNYGSAISVHLWGGGEEIREWSLALGSPFRSTNEETDGRKWRRHQCAGTHGPTRLGIQVFSLEDMEEIVAHEAARERADKPAIA